MNYEYIETLAKKSKCGDKNAKEKLAVEFRPFILNLSKRIFIYGYDKHDIENECYRILFKCLSMYQTERHRFVAYAVNGIKNSMNDIIRKHKTREKLEGTDTLIIDKVENSLISEHDLVLEHILSDINKNVLTDTLAKLSDDEKQLIDFVFIKENNMRNYASFKKLPYSTALYKKKKLLNKISYILNNSKNVIGL